MAVTEKTTRTVNIYINEEGGGTTTWKLNDPVDNLTAEQIRTALSKLFASSNELNLNLLVNRSGYALTSFERAEYEIITKRITTI